MAFGKKDKAAQPVPALEPEDAPDTELAEAELVDETPALELDAIAAPEPTPAADPLAGGTDALLSMFQSTESEAEDRSIFLDLAGDVEIDDLLESLQTVAAALGIVAATAAGADEAPPLADLYEDEDYEAAAA